MYFKEFGTIYLLTYEAGIVILRIILLLSIPTLTTIAAFTFSRSWVEFLYALILIKRKSLIILPIALMRLIFGEVFL